MQHTLYSGCESSYILCFQFLWIFLAQRRYQGAFYGFVAAYFDESPAQRLKGLAEHEEQHEGSPVPEHQEEDQQ